MLIFGIFTGGALLSVAGLVWVVRRAALSIAIEEGWYPWPERTRYYPSIAPATECSAAPQSIAL